jgi:P27 family predicted phage terminase small subunit
MPLPKSRNRKRVAGTLRSDDVPMQSPLDPLRTPPRPPPHLSASARAEWTWLVKACVDLGTIIEADTRALALLAETLATETELRAQVAKDGYTYVADGNRRANPAAKLLEAARNQSSRMLANFGLDPRSRQSVDQQPLPPPGKPKTGLAEFL